MKIAHNLDEKFDVFLNSRYFKGMFFYYISKHLKKSYKINAGNFTKKILRISYALFICKC